MQSKAFENSIKTAAACPPEVQSVEQSCGLTVCDLSSCLNTGVTSAYSKQFMYCKLDNTFKLLYTKYEIEYLFSLIILTGILNGQIKLNM